VPEGARVGYAPYLFQIELYEGEKIVYGGQRLDGDVATVGIKILTKTGTEVPVDYHLSKYGDRWLIYGINVESFSLVSNNCALLQKMKSKQGHFAGQDVQKRDGKWEAVLYF